MSSSLLVLMSALVSLLVSTLLPPLPPLWYPMLCDPDRLPSAHGLRFALLRQLLLGPASRNRPGLSTPLVLCSGCDAENLCGRRFGDSGTERYACERDGDDPTPPDAWRRALSRCGTKLLEERTPALPLLLFLLLLSVVLWWEQLTLRDRDRSSSAREGTRRSSS